MARRCASYVCVRLLNAKRAWQFFERRVSYYLLILEFHFWCNKEKHAPREYSMKNWCGYVYTITKLYVIR